jgi:hypothetical protein
VTGQHTPADITAAATARQIVGMRHFTTNAGITGILATGELRCRAQLVADQYLDRIFYPNCELRVDPRWTGHVSISISHINDSFFSICSGSSKWHRGLDGFWAVLDIDPGIMGDDGVWFTTTNNMYTNVQRGQGVLGFEAMFADVVHPFRPVRSQAALVRNGLGDHQPTDPQAEVLYPGAVETPFIRGIVLRTDEDAHSVSSQVSFFAGRGMDVSHIDVRVDPAAFEPRAKGVQSLPAETNVGDSH